MLSPSEFNNAVPKFTNGNYANNPVDPQYIEEPTLQDYNRGVEPFETLPAQWWNWLCNQFTSRFNKINTYVKNIFDEITQLLSLLNISPDGTESVITTGQLKNFFKELYPTYVSDKLELGTTYVPQTRTVNGHALTGNITVTKSDVGLGSVANTGDSANVSNNGTTKFTTGGAYNILTSIAPYFSTSTAYSVGALVTYQNKFYECTTAHSAGAWNSSHFTARSFSYVFTNYILPAFAPTFSTSTAYSVGTFVIYQNRLYKCTTAHSAGAWNASHFALATLNDVTVDTDGKLALKADKVAGATNNDIAILDTNGNLKDSGKSLADLTGITVVAPLFSTSSAYDVGDYVIYNGNLYRCTVAHSAGAWNASHFTLVTVGSELTNKADNSSLAVPSDAVLHYSFDDLPDLPDGTADVRLTDGNTYDLQSTSYYAGNSGGTTFSNLNGNVQAVIHSGQSWNGLVIQYTTSKIIKIKIKVSLLVGSLRVLNGLITDYIQMDTITSNGEYTYTALFNQNASTKDFGVLVSNTSSSATVEILEIYIGDGSYSTPIIDNANGQNNATNNGGIAVQGVSGKGIFFLKNSFVTTQYVDFLKSSAWSLSFWVNLKRGTVQNPRLYSFGNGEYCFANNFSTTGNNFNFYTYQDTSRNIQLVLDLSPYYETMAHITVITEINLNGSSSKTVYVNGVKKSTSSGTITQVPSTTEGYIGGTGDNNSIDNSILDDFLIFDRALTEAEVKALYLNKANTPKFYDINNYDIEQAETDLSGKVDKTTTVNGHALSDNVTVTKGDVGLGSVVNTGDSAVPVNGGTTKFTSGGAFNFFGRNTDAESWLSKAFGWAMGRYWNTCNQGGDGLIFTLEKTVYTIYHANNLWVAGSDKGIIWSEDGELWDLVDNTATYDFKHIYYANGIWVACSESHGLWWSTDGKTWTQGDGVNINYSFNHVYYANGIWVACSESHGMYWSFNGKTWTQGTGSNTSYTFNDVYYGNNIWVAVSDSHGLWWSSDGKAWTQGTGSNTTYTFNSVRYADYIWVAGSDSHGLWWSSDGKAWNSSNISSSTVTINYIYYANGMWQACGEDRMLYSYDGKSFKSEYNPFLADCRSVYYANGTWVAGTDKGLIWSINGKNWQLGKGNERGGYSQCQFLCVYFAKNYWLAGGIHDSANFVQGFWYSDFDLVELKD